MSEADIPKAFHYSTPKTMKAVICEKHGEKLKICQLPVPVPNDDEVLVKIRASGICHTDVHVCAGHLKSMLPVCPGHEGAGDVVAVGSRVISHVVGDRVGIPWLGSACGSCDQCVSGWETLCATQKNTGFTTDGCLREYATCKASHAIHLPPGISYEQAAPILCAGLTSYKALKESETRPGEWMTIIGAAGGLGHLAVQYAKVMGMRVVAMDMGMTKSKQCLDLGAEAFVDARSEDPVAQILALTQGGSHGVVVVAPSNAAFQTAVQVVRSRGTMVMVALPPGSFPLPIKDVIMRRITIRGSIVGTRQDMHEAISFVTRGLVHCNIETDSLDHVQQVFDRLMRNEVEGRVVVDMTTASTAVAMGGTVGLTEGVIEGEVKREESSLLKKMDGILNDYAGNGEGTATVGGETEKK